MSSSVVLPAVFGNVKIKDVEEMEVEWEITNFLSVIDNFIMYRSPVFSFLNNSWYLELFQTNSLHPDFMTVCLFCGTHRKCSVEYSFGLKKQDGSVEQLNRYKDLRATTFRSDHWKFIKRSDVRTRMSELAPSGNFTVVCWLKCETVTADEEAIELNKPKFKILKKLDTLSDNLKHLIANKESCDTTLHVQGREYKAHRAILIARSSVFAAMFTHETSEKQDGIINITDCDPESFGEFLEFLYSGKLQKLSFLSALHLYETSNKYDVEELKTFCRENLKENLKENLSVENVCDVLIIADTYDETNLMSAAQEFFNENIHKILYTSGWDNLKKNNICLLNKLLKELPSKKRKVAL